MIKINLLPPQLRPIKRSPLPHLISLVFLALALGAMALVYLNTRDAVSAIENRQAEIASRLQALQAVTDEYKRLEAEEKVLQSKVAVIEEILQDRIIWSEWLSSLIELMPENVWLGRVWVSLREIVREEVVIDPASGQPVRDPRTGRDKVETVREREYRLNLSGYVKEDDQGNRDVTPLILNTQRDPEFSRVFEHKDARYEDTDFNGAPVRKFTLEYGINSGGGKEQSTRGSARGGAAS